MASWNLFKHLVASLEGLYQNRHSDFGNKNSLGQFVGTMRGISAPVYEAWIGRPPTVEDMKAITIPIAEAILKQNYWDRLNATKMKTQEVADVIVDHGVNAGTGAAAIITQEVLNKTFNKGLAVDGGIGNLTIAAINSVDQVMLQSAIVEARRKHYDSLQISHPDWYDGWIIRLNKFVVAGENMLLNHKKPIGLGFTMVAIVATLLIFSTNNTTN